MGSSTRSASSPQFFASHLYRFQRVPLCAKLLLLGSKSGEAPCPRGQGAAMTNKLTDIEWISIQLDDIAVLLRTHGIDALANQLDAIRENLRLPHNDRNRKQKKWTRHSPHPHPRSFAVS